MKHLISICFFFILAAPNGRAQDSNAPTTDGTPFPAAIPATTESSPPNSKAIVLVIDADAQKSKVVKEVIAALEKAGIATGKAAETAPPTNSPISVTLNMRKDESYDKIKQLIEALKSAGVQQMSIREGGVQYQGKEINQLKVNRQPGYSPAEYEKIDLAAIAIMDQCGLSLLREVNWMPGKADERNPFDDANLPVSDSSERTNPAMDSGFIPKSSQTADLRTQYEAANKQAHDLAESLRQTPDPAKKSELRTAVQRAFTLRQSLLRAELQEMLTRLEKTQQSLDMRERIADQIVDRRVEDLLNPELKWQLSESLETSPARVARSGSQGGANSVDDVEIHGDTIVPFEHDGLSIPGVGVLGTPDENGMVEVTFQPSPHSTLERLEVGQKVFVSQTLRPTTIGFDRTPIIASGCILKAFWANRQRSASNQPVVLLVAQKQVEGLVEAEKRGALEVHGMSKAGHNETMTPESSPIPIRNPQDAASEAKGTPVDEPKQAMLDKLQGNWDFQELSVENPEPRSFPNGLQMIYEIRGNRMASLPNEPQMPTWHLRFGEPGIPQSIDLGTSAEEADSLVFLGIVEIADDVVRICLNNTAGASIKRPTEFAVTKDTDILELRRRPAPVTELEGDWHLVSITDKAGDPVDVRPMNLTFRKDRYTLSCQGYQNERRVEVYPDSKEIRFFKDETGLVQDHYLLEGDKLTIYGEYLRNVYHRGHVAFPKSIAKATDEQKTLWRSGIVDIYWEHQTPNETRQDPVGKGVVISPTGIVICQVPEEIQSERDPRTKFIVRFDDGGFAYTTIVEEADHGWFALQPTQPSNHQFPISTSAMTIGDQVHLWACDSGSPPPRNTVDLAKVILLDRQATTANTSVCQLTRPSDFRAHCCPVLSGNGELLAITLRGTGDLVLAVPVAELKTMFPKSLGQLPETPTAAEPSADLESEPAKPLQEN